jgi:beta-lactamase class A
MHTGRRQFLFNAGSTLACLAGALGGCDAARPLAGVVQAFSGPDDRFSAIESQSGGRLGIALLDTATGDRAGHRAGERFPMCSTAKVLLGAATLSRIDSGREDLRRRVRITKADLLDYAPVTKDHLGDAGMSVGELCAAAITLSDNTAANLLLRDAGGPAGLTAYVRSLGDPETRSDRLEPDLNEALPGDPRDTTTPSAMLNDLRALTLGDALKPESRKLLIHWLVNNKTGDHRLRAGLPADWRVGDKTGSGERGTTNDIAVLWPPGRKPLLLCACLTGSSKSNQEREAIIASVARAIAQSYAGK